MIISILTEIILIAIVHLFFFNDVLNKIYFEVIISLFFTFMFRISCLARYLLMLFSTFILFKSYKYRLYGAYRIIRNVFFLGYLLSFISIVFEPDKTILKVCTGLIELFQMLIVLLILTSYFSKRSISNKKYALILGCQGSKLNNRIEKFLSLEKIACYEKVILAGGKKNNETISQSKRMEQYLLRKGYPQERILIENKSLTTEQNLCNSFNKYYYLLSDGVDLITSDFHALRTMVLSTKYKIKCNICAANTDTEYWECIVKEVLALVYEKRYECLTVLIYYVFIGIIMS